MKMAEEAEHDGGPRQWRCSKEWCAAPHALRLEEEEGVRRGQPCEGGGARGGSHWWRWSAAWLG
jgi:hypothetical protein